MNRILSTLAVSGLALLGSQALAQSMDVLYSNTIVLSTSGGMGDSSTKYFYEADGTVTADNGRSGTWEAVDGEFCTDIPEAGGQHAMYMCYEASHIENNQPGHSWEIDSPMEGVTITAQIVEGR